MASHNKIKRFHFKHKVFLLFLSIFSISFFSTPTFAAAWLRDQGSGLLIGNFGYYDSCRYWNMNSQLLNGSCFRQFAMNPYFEYGLFPKLTVGINPYFRTFDQSGQTSRFSFNNSIFFGRAQLKKTDWSTLSAQVGYNQPYISKNFRTLPSGSSAYAIANLQQYTDFRLLYGVGKSKWYLDLESAYRNYYQGAASELHFDLMMGIKMDQERFIIELQELNTVGLHNPSAASDPNFSLYTLVPNVIYWIKPKVGIQLGVKQDFYGRNVGLGTEPFFAFWVKF